MTDTTLTIEKLRQAKAIIDQTAPIAGLEIIESPHLVETVEDWSQVRSPSRAERRRKQGHPQRIRYLTVPRSDILAVGDTVYIHPDTMRKAMEMAGDSIRRQQEGMIYGVLRGSHDDN